MDTEVKHIHALIDEADRLRTWGGWTAFENAVIGYVFPEALQNTNQTAANDLVGFVGAYAQGLYSFDELTKHDVKKVTKLNKHYLLYLSGQLVKKAKEVFVQGVSVLSQISLDTIIDKDRDAINAYQLVLEQWLQRVKSSHDQYAERGDADFTPSLEAYLHLEAFAKTIEIRHEMKDTSWRLGLAILKQARHSAETRKSNTFVEKEFDAPLLHVDRVLHCPDFSGPVAAPFTCIEASRYLNLIRLAKVRLDGATPSASPELSRRNTPVITSPPSSTGIRPRLRHFASSSRTPTDDTTNTLMPEIEALERRVAPLVEYVVSDAKCADATEKQEKYCATMMEKLRILHDALPNIKSGTMSVTPVTLGGVALLALQVEACQERFKHLFQRLSEPYTRPSAATTLTNTLRRPDSRPTVEKCVMMNLGAEHRRRLAHDTRSRTPTSAL